MASSPGTSTEPDRIGASAPAAAERSGNSRAFGGLSEIGAILVLVGVFFAILMGAMDSLVVATVLPRIASDLHQVDGVTFVVSAYLISSTIAIPIFSRLSDIASRRNVFLAGLAIFIAGSAFAGLSQNLSELIVFRGIQGLGGGGVFPVAIAMVAVMFPPATRSRVTGILSAAAGIAIVLGPLVGSAIVQVTTWRWVFYINLPFGVMAMAVLLVAVGPLRSDSPGRFDTTGAVLLSAWVGALMFALVQVADSGWAWTNPYIVGLLAGTVASLAAFLVWELRIAEPLVPLRLIGQRVIAASSGAMFFTGVVLNSLITFLSVYVGIVMLQSGPNATGDVRDIIYFLAVPLVVGAALGGQILLQVSYRTMIAAGLGVAGVVALFLAQVTPTTPLWVLVAGFLPVGGVALPLIPLGFGLGLSLSGITIAVQNESPPSEVGAAIGLTRFLQSLGGAVGLSLLTVFESWRYGVLSAGATTPPEFQDAITAAYSEVFLILAICLLLAFGCSLLYVGRVPRPGTNPSERGGPEGVGPSAADVPGTGRPVWPDPTPPRNVGP